MKPFWKYLIVIKTLLKTKLKFYPCWKNWCLISIFGPIGTKSTLVVKKQLKKRFSEQNVSSHTENNILDPIVRELENVAKTEGIKSFSVELVLLIV